VLAERAAQEVCVKKIVFLSLMGLVIAGCSKQTEKVPPSGKPVVYTVNYPLAYFAERIAGSKVEVVFPHMEGDPAFWEPTPEQIAEFQDADLILLNGASYAKWVLKVSLPQARLVDTSTAFKDRLIVIDGAATHSHGPGGAHAHGDIAFTTWLDPHLALQQAVAIRDAFSKHWQMDAADFQALEKELLEFDAQLETAFGEFEDQPLLGSHPIYQYLTRRYNLNMESVHWEPDEAPDAEMWSELNDILGAHPAKLMLWEAEPLADTKAKLEEKGVQSMVFDPCGNRPVAGDFISVMNANIHNLE